MKILLFGESGQLGHEVRIRAGDLNFELIAPVLSELDIGESAQVDFLVRKVEPEVILNCAAYTAVDKAEQESDLAYRINRDGTRHIAQAARQVGCRVLHISTDYVFDGTVSTPVNESHPTNPLNVYGASKLAGEQELLSILGERGLVVRTSSLHGQRGINFVHTMIKLYSQRDTVSVVADQWMCPTWAGWLAEVLLDLTRMSVGGIVHACGKGVISWHEFATAIYHGVRHRLSHEVRILPITAQEFARPAQRPPYSALDCSQLTKILGREPITWEEGLLCHLREIEFGEHLQ